MRSPIEHITTEEEEVFIFRVFFYDRIEGWLRERPAKQGEQLRSVISYKAIEKVLGWKPTVDIREGLKLTAEFFKGKVMAA